MADGLAKFDEEEETGEPWEVRIDRDWRAIEYAPVEDFKNRKEFMMKLCAVNGHALEFAEEDLRADPELVLQAVQHSFGEAFKFGNPELHRQRPFVLNCVSVSAEVLRLVSNRCKNDAGAKVKSTKGVFYCYRRGGEDGTPFKTGPCNPTNAKQCASCARVLDDPDNCPLPQDREFIKMAVKRNWQALKHADEELRGEKDIVMPAVQSGGLAIQYASQELQADRDVALAAVRQTWLAFRLLNRHLRSDREIAHAAVSQDWHAIKLVTKELKTNMELMDMAVRQSWQSFQFMAPEMRRKRSLAMEAVGQSWRAYEFTSKELRGDRELALLAVRQHGQALAWVSDELRADREVVLEALRQDWQALKYASESVRAQKEVLREGVVRNGFALRFSTEELRSEPELVAAAMNQQWPAVKEAVMPLFPAEDGLDPAYWKAISERSGIKGRLRPAVAIGVRS